MRCFDCQREIEVGDRYIEDTTSGFTNRDAAPEVDGLMADIFGGHDGKIVLCTDCTVEGGNYLSETYWGEGER
jgi:hypothetical protein